MQLSSRTLQKSKYNLKFSSRMATATSHSFAPAKQQLIVIESCLPAGLTAHTCAQLKAIEWVVEIAAIILTWTRLATLPVPPADKSTSNGSSRSNLVAANW